MHGQIHDSRAGAVFFDEASSFERQHAGHADIEQHQVGTVLQDQLERHGGIARLTHHGKVGSVFQQAAHAVAQHFVIVGDHAANGLGIFCFNWSSLGGQHGEILAYSDEVRDESGTPGSGDYRYKVRLNCTCTCHAFDAKSRWEKSLGENQGEPNFSSSFTMPVRHAALLHLD